MSQSGTNISTNDTKEATSSYVNIHDQNMNGLVLRGFFWEGLLFEIL